MPVLSQRSKFLCSLASLEASLQLACDLIACLVCIAQAHGCIFLVEAWVWKISIASTHGTLEEDGVLALPDGEDWHSIDWASLDLLSSNVGDVVGTDNEACVNLAHVVIHLVQFEDPIVRNTSLCEQDVHLSGHAAGHWVNAKAHIDIVLLAGASDAGNLGLSPGHSHTIAWDDHDFLGVRDKLCDLIWLDLLVFSWCLLVSTELDGSCLVHTSEDDIEDVTVHGHAHDVCKDSSTEADQRTDNGQQRTLEHETFGDKSPTGVRVEHGNAHRHVTTSDRGHQVD